MRRFFCYMAPIAHDGHSDDRYLGFTFDSEQAIRVLKDLRALGYKRVSVKLMLTFLLHKIVHRKEKLEKMKSLLQVRDSITISGLAKSLGVTRQTIYNWRDAGFLFLNDKGQVDIKETVDFWETIDGWVQ